MTGRNANPSLRALVLAPTPRDAQVTCSLLESAGLASLACPTMGILIERMVAGAGAILLTEEVLYDPDIEGFLEILGQQPSWSDLPVVMMMRGGTDSPAATRDSQRAFHRLSDRQLI